MRACAGCQSRPKLRKTCGECGAKGSVELAPLAPAVEIGLAEALRLTTVRAATPTPGWECVRGFAIRPDSGAFEDDKKGMQSWKQKERVTDEALVVELQRQIRTRFLRQWRELRVVSVVRDKETVYIEVDGEGATWCVNICPPRDHAASRIYFSVDKHGISQRCFCRSEKVPYFKSLCKSFVSTPKPLDKWMVDKLFPKPVVAREG